MSSNFYAIKFDNLAILLILLMGDYWFLIIKLIILRVAALIVEY